MLSMFEVAKWWEIVYIVSLVFAGILFTTQKKFDFDPGKIIEAKGLPVAVAPVLTVIATITYVVMALLPVFNTLLLMAFIRKVFRRYSHH